VVLIVGGVLILAHPLRHYPLRLILTRPRHTPMILRVVTPLRVLIGEALALLQIRRLGSLPHLMGLVVRALLGSILVGDVEERGRSFIAFRGSTTNTTIQTGSR
jgi:hypothetical protein